MTERPLSNIKKDKKVAHNMNNKNSTIKILLPVLIATIAIIWYIFDGLAILNYWYALPIMATLTGIFSVWIIPGVSQKLKQVNSIIATGLTIMGFQIFSNFVAKDKTWIMQFILITIVSIFLLISIVIKVSILPMQYLILE